MASKLGHTDRQGPIVAHALQTPPPAPSCAAKHHQMALVAVGNCARVEHALLPAVAAAWVPMPNATQAARRTARVVVMLLLVAGFPAECVRL